MKGTQLLARKSEDREAEDEKRKTVSLKSREMLTGRQSDEMDSRVECLLKRDKLMSALFQKVRDRFRQ